MSILEKDFPELFKQISSDKTPLVYEPKHRAFYLEAKEIPEVLIKIQYCPFSGKKLPEPLRELYFDIAERDQGNFDVEGPVLRRMNDESWWIERGI